jgi:hypothetical protein
MLVVVAWLLLAPLHHEKTEEMPCGFFNLAPALIR